MAMGAGVDRCVATGHHFADRLCETLSRHFVIQILINLYIFNIEPFYFITAILNFNVPLTLYPQGPKGLAELSQIFIRDTHILQK
jgi:hypothetical protein